MKHLKMIGLGSVVAMAFIAFAASAASATTLEITGVAQNQSLELVMSEAAGTSTSLKRTDGTVLTTCTTESKTLTTISTTGTTVTAPNTGTTGTCIRPLTVHNEGQLYIEYVAGTTDGTVFSENTQITFQTPLGTINCQTGAGTDIGILKGTAAGNATLTINTVINCGFLAPSVAWKADWIVTSPHGLGVVA